MGSNRSWKQQTNKRVTRSSSNRRDTRSNSSRKCHLHTKQSPKKTKKSPSCEVLFLLKDKEVKKILTGRNRAEKTLAEGLTIRPSARQKEEMTVFTTDFLPKRLCFGPLQGEYINNKESVPFSRHCWRVLDKDGEIDHYIDGKDKSKGNWMRFVNHAIKGGDQNLEPFQYQGHIYFRTTKHIPVGIELRLCENKYYVVETEVDPVNSALTKQPGHESEALHVCFTCMDCHASFTDGYRYYRHMYIIHGQMLPSSTVCDYNEKNIGDSVTSILNALVANTPVATEKSTSKQIDPVMLPSKSTDAVSLSISTDQAISVGKSSNLQVKPRNPEIMASKAIDSTMSGIEPVDTEQPSQCDTVMEVSKAPAALDNNHNVRPVLSDTTSDVNKPCKPMGNSDGDSRSGIVRNNLSDLSQAKLASVSGDENEPGDQRDDCCHHAILPIESEAPARPPESSNIQNHLNRQLIKNIKRRRYILPRKEVRHACLECGRDFQNMANLRRHAKIHRGQRDHECPNCHRRFTELADLRSHIYLHTGERPYKCYFCNMGFASTGSRGVHIRKKHPAENKVRLHFKSRGYTGNMAKSQNSAVMMETENSSVLTSSECHLDLPTTNDVPLSKGRYVRDIVKPGTSSIPDPAMKNDDVTVAQPSDIEYADKIKQIVNFLEK